MGERAGEMDEAWFPPVRHNCRAGERCLGCVRDGAMEAQKAYVEGITESAETLATARRVSGMYFLRTKTLAAALSDARGLVRGMDTALDERIDAALTDAAFAPPRSPAMADLTDAERGALRAALICRGDVHAAAASIASERVAEVVRAIEAELDDSDQLADSLKAPNYITVWGVRRVLLPFGGKPHRWPMPAECCAECEHRAYDHDEECGWDDCDCLLSRREAEWGRDEAMDDTITAALREDAVSNDEPWTREPSDG